MSITRTTSTANRRVIALMAAVAMIFALAPVGAASAHNAVVAAVAGTASLPAGIGAACQPNPANNPPGSFTGSAVGVHGVGTTAPGPINGPATATFRYCNPDTITGFASGSITIDGHTCGFDWERVGVTAIIFFSGGCGGGGVAGFAPNAAQNGATVAGVGAAT